MRTTFKLYAKTYHTKRLPEIFSESLSLSKKAAEHLRQMILEYYWQVEMALQGAISFEHMPQISRFSDPSHS